MPDNDDLLRHLDLALSASIHARVLAGALPDDVPDIPVEALDAALRADGEYGEARAAVREALDVLEASVDGETWKMVLEVEASMNQRYAVTSDVIWRLAWTAASRWVSEK